MTTARRGARGPRRPEAPDLRLGEVEIGQRAQERVRDEHVHERLGHLVDRRREARGDRRIEVGHLDFDPDRRLPESLVVFRQPPHIDAQVARSPPRPRHQQPVADRPGYAAGVGADRGTREDRSATASTAAPAAPPSARLVVHDPDQPERDPGEKAPVGPGEVLEVGCDPQPLEVTGVHRQLARLNGAHRRRRGRSPSSGEGRRSQRGPGHAVSRGEPVMDPGEPRREHGVSARTRAARSRSARRRRRPRPPGSSPARRRPAAS